MSVVRLLEPRVVIEGSQPTLRLERDGDDAVLISIGQPSPLGGPRSTAVSIADLADAVRLIQGSRQ